LGRGVLGITASDSDGRAQEANSPAVNRLRCAICTERLGSNWGSEYEARGWCFLSVKMFVDVAVVEMVAFRVQNYEIYVYNYSLLLYPHENDVPSGWRAAAIDIARPFSMQDHQIYIFYYLHSSTIRLRSV